MLGGGDSSACSSHSVAKSFDGLGSELEGESRKSRKSKLKTESCFGGSRVEILSFHLESGWSSYRSRRLHPTDTLFNT
eukprot:scaffold67140_cov53-Attheya_sp.AAC.3